MRLALAALASILLWPAVALAGPDKDWTGELKTKRFTVRFRPGSRAAAEAKRAGAMAEMDLDRIAAALDTTPKGPYVLWLYDDIVELAEATGTKGTGGYSSSDGSHVPYDVDQTRLHELVHLVAYEWPATGPEKRNLFLAEGLANAVLEYVSGVHVHAVAAHYLKANRLPSISEMADTPDFYAWLGSHPGLNVYDIAGSWVRFLIDAHGLAKTKRYYTGTPAKTAFGSDLPAIEKAWRMHLTAFPVQPETETLLQQRDGADVRFKPLIEGVPPDVLGKPSDWKALLGKALTPEKPDRWKASGETLVATNTADEWTACDLGEELPPHCAVRARVVTTGYTPFQVRWGADNQVMFVQPGTFLFRGEAGVASDPTVKQPGSSTKCDLVVARRGRRIQAWVNGRLALDTNVGTEDLRPVGLGIHKGTATFQDVSIRTLP